jgi:hypothetical protein
MDLEKATALGTSYRTGGLPAARPFLAGAMVSVCVPRVFLCPLHSSRPLAARLPLSFVPENCGVAIGASTRLPWRVAG